jgi:hypothetical protein
MIRVRERLFAAPHFGRSGGTRRCPRSGVKRTSRFQGVMSASDPKRTFQLFSRHPPWCIFVGADLAPNDLDVTAQIIQLVGKG